MSVEVELASVAPPEPDPDLKPDLKDGAVAIDGFRNVRFAEVLRSRISSELGIRSDQLSPACIMDIAQLEEVQKFVDVEGSVTDLLKRYHKKLQSLVDKVAAVTENVTAETEKLDGEADGKALLDETSQALKTHLISFAQEAAEFYTDMGQLYLNLYKDMTKSTADAPTPATQNAKADSKAAKSSANKPAVPAEKEKEKKDPAAKKVAPSPLKIVTPPTKEKEKSKKSGSAKSETKKDPPPAETVPKPDIQPEEDIPEPEKKEGKKDGKKSADAKKKPDAKQKSDTKKTAAPSKKAK